MVLMAEDRREFIGDCAGKDVIIYDDMIDTGAKAVKATRAVKQAGAKRVIVFATHGLFNPPVILRINDSEIDEVIVTDSIPLRSELRVHPKITQVSCSELIAEAIRRLHMTDEKPLSELV